MKKAKSTANEPTIIERHNTLFRQIEAAKTADDVRVLVEAVKGFIVSYKNVDKAMTKRIYEKLLNKVNDMVVENEFRGSGQQAVIASNNHCFRDISV